MKTNFRLTFIIGLILLSACVINVGGSNIKYTHLPPEGKNMPVQPFTSIKANGVFNIILQQGNTEGVIVKNDFPSDLKVTNDGNTLIIIDTISNHDGIHDTKTNIYITYKQLSAIETESVGEIKTLDTIKAGKFTFESDGVGENILYLNADSVTASENGVGSLTIAGKAHYANIDDNGVGKLKARDFKVDILHASVNGVGAATVNADSEIYLDANGIGGITYYGNAKVMENTSGGIGKISHGN
ncbi:MAG TPA: head GIN domain-containing protein [Bacteroidia bacterium]|nr:head GIN domain-containing protein [Bacteroidia bacterium]